MAGLRHIAFDFRQGQIADDMLSDPRSRRYIAPTRIRNAKYAIGHVVRHRFFPFRGVVFDIDPVFDNTEEWWLAIPAEMRPRKDQPFYHLFAENAETTYVAYVSEQNLLPDVTRTPVKHPRVKELFVRDDRGGYRALFLQSH
jgi:heat shock protein HspQ